MKPFIEEYKEVRYFPNDSEMPILIHYLQVYFSHPERSIQRSQVVQSVVSILSTKNKHWTHRTVRLWFNNNKRVFFRPSSPGIQQQQSHQQPNQQTKDNAVVSSQAKAPYYVPARSLSVVQLPNVNSTSPAISQNNLQRNALNNQKKMSPQITKSQSQTVQKIPVQIIQQAHNMTPQINQAQQLSPIISQPKPGSFAFYVMSEAENLMSLNPSTSQVAEKNITEKLNVIHEKKWNQFVAVQPSRTSIMDYGSIPSSGQSQMQNTPNLESIVGFDLIECSHTTSLGEPVVVAYNSDINRNKLHFLNKDIEVGDVHAMTSMDDHRTIWIHSGSNIIEYILSNDELIKGRSLPTHMKHANRSTMTFWNDNVVLASGSSIRSWSPRFIEENTENDNSLDNQIEQSNPDSNLIQKHNSSVGLGLTLPIPLITSLAAVSESLVVASTEHHSAQVYAPNGTLITKSIGHTAGITCLHSFDACSFITGSADQTAKYWDLRVQLPIFSLLRHHGIVTCAYGCGNVNSNLILTGGTDGIIRGWDIRQLRHLFSFSVGYGSPGSIGLSNDSKTITVITSERVKDHFYDLEKYGYSSDLSLSPIDAPLNAIFTFSIP